MLLVSVSSRFPRSFSFRFGEMTKDMRIRIQEQTGMKPPEDIKSLNLDACKAPAMADCKELLHQYTNLEDLAMAGVGLCSIQDFPRMPKLRKLDLCDNRLNGGLQHIAISCPSLAKLLLGGNRIRLLSTLEPLRFLSFLTSLELCECEITTMDSYREKVLEYLPQLKDLDGVDRNGNKAAESEDSESDDEYSDSDTDAEGANDENDENMATDMDMVIDGAANLAIQSHSGTHGVEYDWMEGDAEDDSADAESDENSAPRIVFKRKDQNMQED